MCRGSSQSSAWTIGTSSSVPKVKSDILFRSLYCCSTNCILPSQFKLWSVLNLSVCLSQLGNEASSVWNFTTRFSFSRLNFFAGKPVVSSWNGCFLKAGFHLRRSRCRIRKSAYDPVKIKNRSHQRDLIGVRRIRTFPFFATPSTTPVAWVPLMI